MCKGACAGSAAVNEGTAATNIVVHKNPAVCATCEFGGESRKAAGVTEHLNHDHSEQPHNHDDLVAARSARVLTDTSGLPQFT